MSYYTERQNMRRPVEKTYEITPIKYDFLWYKCVLFKKNMYLCTNNHLSYKEKNPVLNSPYNDFKMMWFARSMAVVSNDAR